VISRESLARFVGDTASQAKSDLSGGFDMDGFLAKHAFVVIRRKPWQSHPGGLIYELAHCPFNSDHANGSAAFTTENGKPGFRCQHDGCRGKTIKDVFARYPSESAGGAKRESGTGEGKPKAPQSQLLTECAVDTQLFHTPEGEAFVSLPVGDHREVWPVKSRGCRRWLTRAFFQRLGKPPSAQAMQDALALLEAKAQFDSPVNQVFTRVAPCSEGMYLDLCNERWEAVEITSKGWRIVQNPSVRFRRSRGMQPLPNPARDGSLFKLRSLINGGDEKKWILILSWLVAACRPQGPYPILILQGEQGSAKSTAAKLLRGIVDPVTVPVRTPPREERDLLIAANNSWVVAYDNLSSIPQWLSDALCRLAAGGGFSTRELYTDTEEVILDLTRPVILNGIDHLAERPDLADRAIVLNLPRIEETARRDETQLYTAYELERPLILGGLLTAISAALARLPEVRLARKPRMADFALWATAAEVALGFLPGAFMDAYSGNRFQAVQETLESDPVSAAILALISDEAGEGQWSGTAGGLLKHLERIVEDGVKKSPAWPKTPRGLSSRLRRLTTFLRESGTEVTFHDQKGTGGQRMLTVRRMASHLIAPTATTASAEPGSPLNQAISTEVASGGPSLSSADEPHQGDLPPLEPFSDNPLNRHGFPQQGAEGAVACEAALVGPSQSAMVPDRLNECACRGPVDWQWNGSAWVCPVCGGLSAENSRSSGLTSRRGPRD
jgi:hypothetical protein